MQKYSPVGFSAVKLTGPFWTERLDTVLTKTIPSQHVKLAESGILESLDLADPPPPLRIPRNGHGFTTQIFWDSDIGKWIEAAAYALAHRRDERLEAQVDAIVEKLAAAQLEDGYLNLWSIGREPDKRWTNLRDNHEMYNAGHLLEGAIAYFEATGKRKLLDVMERYVDHIGDMFGAGEGQRRGYPGHQELELALVKLYRLTGEAKYLDLACYFIDERGQEPHYFVQEAEARGEKPGDFAQGTFEYNQSHVPVREQRDVVGHAVRAMYMYAAMADLLAETGDAELRDASEALWTDATARRMYVTGGFGPSESNEGFTAPYDLPNGTAYAETCATVAMIFWAQRMLHLELDGQYADALELGLFNGALSGLSRDGCHYFYENKLASDGGDTRWDWHMCPCCTMNVSRLIASVGGYFHARADDGFAIHLYGGAETRLTLAATDVRISETSDYPYDGAVRVEVEPHSPVRFALRLRVPGWCRDVSAKVNGVSVDVAAQTDKGYLVIEREWHAGDEATLHLGMVPERIYARPEVDADFGAVALRRGPLVYCFEAADNHGLPVAQTALARDADVQAVSKPDLFGGTIVLEADGKVALSDDWGEALYRSVPPVMSDATLTAIPYFLWNNRGANAMRVWIRDLGAS